MSCYVQCGRWQCLNACLHVASAVHRDYVHQFTTGRVAEYVDYGGLLTTMHVIAHGIGRTSRHSPAVLKVRQIIKNQIAVLRCPLCRSSWDVGSPMCNHHCCNDREFQTYFMPTCDMIGSHATAKRNQSLVPTLERLR